MRGLKNVLALTGDYVMLGATTLTYMIHRLVHEGKDIAGNDVPNPPKMHVGVAAGPGVDPIPRCIN